METKKTNYIHVIIELDINSKSNNIKIKNIITFKVHVITVTVITDITAFIIENTIMILISILIIIFTILTSISIIINTFIKNIVIHYYKVTCYCCNRY